MPSFSTNICKESGYEVYEYEFEVKNVKNHQQN